LLVYPNSVFNRISNIPIVFVHSLDGNQAFFVIKAHVSIFKSYVENKPSSAKTSKAESNKLKKLQAISSDLPFPYFQKISFKIIQASVLKDRNARENGQPKVKNLIQICSTKNA